MSRLRELIDELCPDGVEYSKLVSCAIVQRTPKGILRSRYGEGSKYPIIDQGQGLIAGYTDNKSLVLRYEEGCVIFGDHTRAIKWIDFPFAVGADGVKVLQAKSCVMNKYLYYAMQNLRIIDRGYYRHWTIVKELVIPVPPIEVQREIVRILDSFQELDDALTAEIEAREKQLDCLRAKVYADRTYPLVPLGSVGTFERGKRFTRAQMGGKGVPCVHYGDIYTQGHYIAHEPFDRLTEDAPRVLRYANRGDVVVAATSENAEDVCTAVVWDCDERAAVHDDCQILRHDQDPLYLSMFFNSEPFARQKMRFVTESKVVRISGDEMAQIKLSMPPIETQKRIAFDMRNMLDLMDALRSERDARRKQFAYYRDKLLAFPERSREVDE